MLRFCAQCVHIPVFFVLASLFGFACPACLNWLRFRNCRLWYARVVSLGWGGAYRRCGDNVDNGRAPELLEIERRPMVATRRSLPFGGQVDVGMFVHASYSDAIALCLQPGSEGARPHKLRFASLASELVSGDRYRVLGPKAEHAPCSVSASDLWEQNEEPGAGASRQDPSELDWEAAALPKPKRRRQEGAGAKQKPANERRGEPMHSIADCFEDLLDGPGGAGDFLAAMELLDNSCSEEEAQSEGEEASGEQMADAAPEDIEVPIAATNCIDRLWRCAHPDEVFAALPEFAFASGWTVIKRDGGANRLLGKIKCIQGSSLRADCRIHARCKLHLNISGHFAATDAAVVRWCIAGSALSAEEHNQAAAASVRLFGRLAEELANT